MTADKLPITPEMQEIEDERMINEAFQRLIDTYLASNHRKKVDLITRAFNFAKQAHKGVRRRSGIPYILHPIAVAQVVCEEIGLGSTSICAALLHDVEEDTDYTNADIANLFGPKIARIVGGVTKISGGIFGDKASIQAESLKKLLLTMSDDIRVVLVKLADRLHNMRTLESMLPSKQYKIAGETLYIYAPIAERLGLHKIKTELEVLSFKYEHPDAYNVIEQKLAKSQVQRNEIFESFTAPIREVLDKLGINYHIKARIKSPYSIWKKMQKKHISFEEVYDLLAIRIVFQPKDKDNEINECFSIYNTVVKIYNAHTDRLRDWVNQPKANGYQALHVTLMSKQGQWIEVQIRSERMDDIAEHGFAAHWKYKGGEAFEGTESEFNRWINSIKEILDDPQPDTLDFLDTFKLNLFASEISVFTPKGEIKQLPMGATVLDFAFAIHSFLGTHCIAAKVDHKLVALNHVLKSGDQVEVITSTTQHVQEEWLNFVTTAKAKSKINALLRKENTEKRRQGETLLQQFLAKHDFKMNSETLDKLCHLHHCSSREKLFTAIGDGSLILAEIDIDYLNGKKINKKGWRKYLPFWTENEKLLTDYEDNQQFISSIDKKKTLHLHNHNLGFTKVATCCNPIPGDDTIGYIDDKNTLVLHKRNCEVVLRLKSNFGNKLVAVDWEGTKEHTYLTKLFIQGLDSSTMLLQIAKVLSSEFKITTQSITLTGENGIFEGYITIYIHNTEELKDLCKALKKLPNIENVTRVETKGEHLKKN